jgi:hypothetical protein
MPDRTKRFYWVADWVAENIIRSSHTSSAKYDDRIIPGLSEISNINLSL